MQHDEDADEKVPPHADAGSGPVASSLSAPTYGRGATDEENPAHPEDEGDS